MQSALSSLSRSIRPRSHLSRLVTLRTCILPYCYRPAPARTFCSSPRFGEEQDADAEMAPKAGKPIKFELKTPKGTKDCFGAEIVVRDKIFKTIIEVFKRHGGVTIDTPVFELKEILSGKYGEDSKLIYDLADQGGEITSLRYDLTVPFARWLAMNSKINSIKRYHLAKVYRRDQPAVTKGRMREFYQCDFDIAGAYDPMVPDAEIIRIINEVFDGLGWQGTYTIKLNHRKILDGIFQVCGVPEDKIRTISSAVDKLDKLPWTAVRQEMVEEKGLAPEIADKIGQWVVLKGRRDLLEKLRSDAALSANELMKQGMDDLDLLFSYLDYFNASNTVSFDLSLARGLDYYTGVIYEVVTDGSAPTVAPTNTNGEPEEKTSKKKGPKPGVDVDEDRSNDPSIGVGSVAAGGRYDNLVGMFSGKQQIPCVGISFGVERILSITNARLAADKSLEQARGNEADVYVMAFGGKGFTGLLKERCEVCATLWGAGIKAEFLYKVKPKLPAQFKAAEVNGVPFAVILGEDELAQGKVRWKEMGLRDGHPEKEGVLIDLDSLAEEVTQRLARKKELDEMTRQAQGLRVVHGIKGDNVKTVETAVADTGESVKLAEPAVAHNDEHVKASETTVGSGNKDAPVKAAETKGKRNSLLNAQIS